MSVRPSPVLAAALVVAMTAGCEAGGDARTPSSASSTSASAPEVLAPTLPARPEASTRALPPASAQGGACREISFDTVARSTGIRFDIAGASGSAGETQTCALQPLRGTVPELLFSSIPVADDLTPDGYASGYVPQSAASLEGIGRAGYSRVVTDVAGAGPRVEIGWLGTGRVYRLSLTTARSTSRSAAQLLVPELVALGRQIVE